MKVHAFSDFDLDIARTRIVLSLLAMLSLYVDPSAGGLFHLTPWLLATLLCHLAYSTGTYFLLQYQVAQALDTGGHDAARFTFCHGSRVPDRRPDRPFLHFFRVRDYRGRCARNAARNHPGHAVRSGALPGW